MAMKALKTNAVKNSDNFWFLSETDDLLKDVTSEKSNEKLGILNITVLKPERRDGSPITGLIAAGGICKISLDTTVAYIDGITIWNNKAGDGSIYMTMQSRDYEKDGQKQYIRDTRLKKQVQAQILRYVYALLEDANDTENDAE